MDPESPRRAQRGGARRRRRRAPPWPTASATRSATSCAAASRSRAATCSAWTAACPPSRASASAAAGCSPPTASRTCFGRKQELFVTAFREEEDRDAFDFVRYGGLTVQTARALSPQLEPDPALDLPGDAHLQHDEDCLARSTASSARPRSPARPPPWSTTPATTRWTRAAATSSAPTCSSRTACSGGDSFVKGFVQAADLPAPHRAHAAGALRAAGPGAHLRRASRSCAARCPTASSRAATTACAASAWTTCVRTAATRSLLGGAELRVDVGGALLARPPSPRRATSTRWSPT